MFLHAPNHTAGDHRRVEKNKSTSPGAVLGTASYYLKGGGVAMRAAQNPSDHLVDAVAVPEAAVTDPFASLPPALRAVIATLLVARMCVPALLRAIDDHRLSNAARTHITRSEDWLEVLRIRSAPRPWVNRQPPADPQPAPSPPPGELEQRAVADPTGEPP